MTGTNEMDWTKKLELLSKEELEKLLIITVGMLSVSEPWSKRNTNEIFNYLFKVASIIPSKESLIC